MFRVLIADDEISICRLIQYLVPWEELGLEIIDVVYNGFAAMDVIREKKVDILITDAKMPGCDGIELIKWCQENNTGVKCIVISGFRRFEYAHGAIRYGADAYLLKPIHQEDLISALKKVIEEIRRKHDVSRLHSQMDTSKKSMKDYFMNTYFLDGAPREVKDHNLEKDWNSLHEKSQISTDTGFYQMVYFKISFRWPFSDGRENTDSTDSTDSAVKVWSSKGYTCLSDESKNSPMDCALQVVLEAAGSFLDQYDCEHIESIYKLGVYSFINYHQMKPEEFQENIRQLSELLEKKIEEIGSFFLTVGLSPVETNIGAIRKKRLCAVEAVGYRLRHPYEKLFVYDLCSYPNLERSLIFTEEMQELVRLYTNALNISGLKNILFKCRMAIKKYENYNPGDICAVIREFFSVVFEQNVADIDIQLPGLKKRLDVFIEHSISEKELWEGAESLLDAVAVMIDDARKQGQNKPVANAKNYIDAHFAEAITLEDVADAVHLNPRYLCKIFHEQTGLTYSEYLTIRRMEYAAKELQNGRLSVASIANAAGYQDVKYFTKLFKKQMGIRPSTYRRIYQ